MLCKSSPTLFSSFLALREVLKPLFFCFFVFTFLRLDRYLQCLVANEMLDSKYFVDVCGNITIVT